MSNNELKQLYLSDVPHIKQGDSDIIRGKVLTIYPKREFFTDKYNYKIYHIIYVKDIINNIMAHDRFPSAHENLNMVNEMMYFIPTIKYIFMYYFITYNYNLRRALKSNYKGHFYSLSIPLIGLLVVNMLKNGGNYFYDKYLKDDIFCSDPKLAEDKILSFKINSMQYNDFLYRYHLKTRKVIYTDQQLNSLNMDNRT